MSLNLERADVRRSFLTALGATTVAAACRSRAGRGPLILRLSHSMASGATALHVFGDTFRQLAEERTGGAVTIHVFPSGTLGQEREVVQQVQEGLVDFMVSGTAIWGSVAPELQVFDFPFMWRDWAHVHRIVDGPIGREAADYLERSVRMRPFAWGDSFGFRQVVTRSRDVNETSQLAGLKIRTIQSPIYVKAVELMGAEPDADGLRRGLHVAADRRHRWLRTRREHDAAAALYEIAGFMARTKHIAGVLGLWASTATLQRLPADLAGGAASRRRSRAAVRQRAIGTSRRYRRHGAAREERHEDSRDRRQRAAVAGRTALELGGARPRYLVVARGDSRVSGPVEHTDLSSPSDRLLQWSMAALVVAQAAVVGLQVVGRHILHSPIPWTEEIARLLLAWLMCVGGIAALRHAQHPRVTAARAPARGAADGRRSIAGSASCSSRSSSA